MLVRILGALALVAVLAIGGLALVPWLVPAETVRAQVAAQIESRTGWRVSFDGPVSLSVFPEIALTAERLRVESAPDARDALAADLDRVGFGLALAPLLSGSVRITEISLQRPVVRLVRGVGPARPDAGEGAFADALAQVSVERLVVADGLVVLRSESGETRLTDLALTLAMPDPARRTRLEASGALDGRPLALEAMLDAPVSLLAGDAANFSGTLRAPGLLASPLEVAGRATQAVGRLVLHDLAMSSGESRLGGEADIVFAGGAPGLDARLSGPLLDLDALLPTGGSSDAIDLSALGAVVGDVELALDRLRLGGREIAPIALQAQLEDDAATVLVDGAGIGGGSLSGEARIGRDGALARISGRLLANGLDAAALAPDGPATLAGRVGADLRFAMAGETRSALVASLNVAGNARLDGGTARVSALSDLVAAPDADRVSDLALAVTITDLAAPIALEGGATWRGERFALSGEAAARPLLGGEPGALVARLRSDRLALAFDGTLSPAGAFAGSVSLQTGSLRGLLSWLGRPVSTPDGLGPFAVSGRLDSALGRIGLSDARLSLDGASGSGRARLALGPRPSLEAALTLDRLDLNPYFGLDPDAAGAGGPWSETPIDLSVLRGLDADLSLDLGGLVFRRIETGPARIAARLSGGRLEAELGDVALYRGSGRARIVVDASKPEPDLALKLALADVDALPFLDAAAGLRRIEGRGALDLDVTGRLVTQRILMETLAGTAGFSFRDGAVRGIDVTEIANLLATGIVEGWGLREDARTPLFAFESRFTVADGRATTQDLRLVGPSVDTTGSGTIDLPAQRLSMRVEPRVAVERRRGAGVELVGFGAPIRIEGPWARPRIYPDIAGILQDPVGAYEQLRSLGRGVFGIEAPRAEEALGRLVGEDAARGIGQLLGVPQAPPQALQQAPLPADPQPPGSEAPPPIDLAPSLEASALPPAPAPPPDPALDAARGILDLLLQTR